jgi:hypothetical protein
MFNRTFNFLPVITQISIVMLMAGISCIHPDEYNPQEQKLPPPGPPDIIKPFPDTVICEGPVIFDWTIPPGSEIFQIQTDTITSFSTADIFQSSAPGVFIFLNYYGTTRITYYVRIRAGSSHWTDYTVWSDIRRFYLWRES